MWPWTQDPDFDLQDWIDNLIAQQQANAETAQAEAERQAQYSQYDVGGSTVPDTSAGFLTMEDLIPDVVDDYDWTGFEDVLGTQFDTGFLEATRKAGRQDIANTIGQSQAKFMQTPTDSSLTGALGFSGAGGGARGLIDYGTAQQGLFEDAYTSMLGASKADMAALEDLKDKSMDFFLSIQPSLTSKKTQDAIDDFSDADMDDITGGASLSEILAEPGPIELDLPSQPSQPSVPLNPGTEVGERQWGEDGQLYDWDGTNWVLVDVEDLNLIGTGDSLNSGNPAGVNQPNQPNVNSPMFNPGAMTGGGSGGGGCFLKDTMILLENGDEIPIQDIKIGMKVFSYDEKDDMLKIGKVVKTFFHPKENTYLIINDMLFITPNHPVLINKEWVEAGNLKEGDMLTNRDNELVEIESIKNVNDVVDVYNFEVEKYHTYIAEGIIVHNKTNQGLLNFMDTPQQFLLPEDYNR